MCLQMWWGEWLLFNYPNQYAFDDFLVSNFAILFSLFGLGAAFQDMADRKEAEKSASRIFYLLDRKSNIDPLSSDGKILSSSTAGKKKKRKSSVKRKKSSKQLESTPEGEEKESPETDTKVKRSSSAKPPKKKKSSSKKLNGDGEVESPKSPKKKKSMKKKKSEKKLKSQEADE